MIDKKNKKAQEEIVGFAIIMVLVVIIGLVFLGFSLRQQPEPVIHQESMMIDTMYTMLAYSTCGTNARQLVKDCYLEPGKECNGKPVCEHVEELFRKMLDETLGEDLANSYVHGYMLNISISDSRLVYLEKEVIMGNYFGATVPIQAAGEDILFQMRYYYRSISLA